MHICMHIIIITMCRYINIYILLTYEQEWCSMESALLSTIAVVETLCLRVFPHCNGIVRECHNPIPNSSFNGLWTCLP